MRTTSRNPYIPTAQHKDASKHLAPDTIYTGSFLDRNTPRIAPAEQAQTANARFAGTRLIVFCTAFPATVSRPGTGQITTNRGGSVRNGIPGPKRALNTRKSGLRPQARGIAPSTGTQSPPARARQPAWHRYTVWRATLLAPSTKIIFTSGSSASQASITAWGSWAGSIWAAVTCSSGIWVCIQMRRNRRIIKANL